MKIAKTETSPEYKVKPLRHTDSTDDELIHRAIAFLLGRLQVPGTCITSPNDAKNLAVLEYAALPHEEFGVLLFDAQHRLLGNERMFRGTLSQTSVYPREVVKTALHYNAAAVILVHNHPSGSPEPSRADECLTTTLKQALALVDVRVLDHLVVGHTSVVSFAERGLL